MKKQLILLLLTLAFGVQSAICAELDIIYWSDLHSQNTPGVVNIDDQAVSVGGVPRLAGMLKAMAPDENRTLIINAGNDFTGTPVSSITKGASQIDILNKLGIDIFVPGAHEFDHGWKSLKKVSKQADFSILLANVQDTAAGTTLFPPYELFHKNGIDVAVIGIISPVFRFSIFREGILGLQMNDILTEAASFVKTFKDSADILVAVTNVGWLGDSLLAENRGDFDLIIGGSNDTAYVSPRIVNDVLIVQAGSHSRNIGWLSLEVDTNANRISRHDGSVIELKEGVVEPDEKLASHVAKLEKKYTKKLNRSIGKLAIDWNIERRQPCNLAQWVTGVMLKSVPVANLAMINNGSLKKGLPAGNITERDIWEIFPMESPMVVIQLTGRELIHIVSRQLKNPPEYCTWQGLHVISDDGKTTSIKVNGYKVHDLDEFSIVTTGFVWENLAYYTGIRANPKRRPCIYLPVSVREMLIETIEKERVVSKPLDNRWDVN